jgi:hypothetical protein
MRRYIEAESRCVNCGTPHSAERRLRQGRCPTCYAYRRTHGTENPLTFAPRSTRTKRAPNGRVVYGKSCPNCDVWIAMRATFCPSCAQVARYRGAAC